MTSWVEAVIDRNYAKLIKHLEVEIQNAGDTSGKERAVLHSNLAACLFARGLLKRCVKECDSAITLDPGSLRARITKARALAALHRPTEANALLDEALRLTTPFSDVAVIELIHDLMSASEPAPSPDVGLAAKLGQAAICDPAPRPAPPARGTAPEAPTERPAERPIDHYPTERPADRSGAGQPVEVQAEERVARHAPRRQDRSPCRETRALDDRAQTHAEASSSNPDRSHSPSRKDVLGAAASPPGAPVAPMTAEECRQLIDIAVQQINTGNVDAADSILSKVIDSLGRQSGHAERLQLMSAYVARGTARALRTTPAEMKKAVSDFGEAIKIEPRYADSYKRRAQARCVLGHHSLALDDLHKCLEHSGGLGDAVSRADTHTEIGRILMAQGDHTNAASQLKVACALDPNRTEAWAALGKAQVSLGDLDDGIATLRHATEMDPKNREAWFTLGYALKEQGNIKEGEIALLQAIQLDREGRGHLPIWKLIAHAKQGLGNHRGAVKVATEALKRAQELVRVGLLKREQMGELMMLRGACNHALGQFKSAQEDYSAVWKMDQTGMSGESAQLRYVAFYQEELAIYLSSRLERRVDSFCMDKELHPRLKQNWCMKAPPSPALISETSSRPKGKKGLKDIKLPDPGAVAPGLNTEAFPISDGEMLVKAADLLGSLIQYKHQGFLPNARQFRMAGLAAIEMAQTMRRVVGARLSGSAVSVPDIGSSTGGLAGRDSTGSHAFGWRDLADIVVRWRQVAEPNDQVVWVDLLAKEEFEAGFGSHTPMYTGQTKCVRYYYWADRALEMLKSVVANERKLHGQDTAVDLTEEQLAAVRKAESCGDVWRVVEMDCWNVVPIHSTHRPGHAMEGTRLTIVKVPNVPNGFEFSIRTPVTPARWADFDVELSKCFENVVERMAKLEAYRDGSGLCLGAPKEALREMAEAILLLAYYWYNFMPLARGTAAVGYITILGLFLAAGMPVNRFMPEDEQTDWEAILERDPGAFIRATGETWLYPAALEPSTKGPVAEGVEEIDVAKLPDVVDAFPLVKSRLIVLSAAFSGAGKLST